MLGGKNKKPMLRLGQSWEVVAVHVAQSFTEDGKTWTSATPGKVCRLEFAKFTKKKSNQKTNKKRPKSGQEGHVSKPEKRAKLQVSGTPVPSYLLLSGQEGFVSNSEKRANLQAAGRPVPLRLQTGKARREGTMVKVAAPRVQAAAGEQAAMYSIEELRSDFKKKETSLDGAERQAYAHFSAH